MADFPEPVFILAPPRSFTSVFCGVLGQHPELLGSPELNLFRFKTMAEFIRAPLLHFGVLRLVAQLYAGEQTVETIKMARRWMAERRDRTTADVHRELCAKIAPLALVEKSPRYIRQYSNLERLAEGFPRARFIQLLRHPRGQCDSVMAFPESKAILMAGGALDRSGPKPIIDPQIVWHDYNLRIIRFLEKVEPERQIRVMGERFMADLDGELTRICAWLGISTSRAAIDAMKHPEDSPFACFGPINARGGNDPNFARDPKLRPYNGTKKYDLYEPLPWRPDGKHFHPRVIEMAREFGYA